LVELFDSLHRVSDGSNGAVLYSRCKFIASNVDIIITNTV